MRLTSVAAAFAWKVVIGSSSVKGVRVASSFGAMPGRKFVWRSMAASRVRRRRQESFPSRGPRAYEVKLPSSRFVFRLPLDNLFFP